MLALAAMCWPSGVIGTEAGWAIGLRALSRIKHASRDLGFGASRYITLLDLPWLSPSATQDSLGSCLIATAPTDHAVINSTITPLSCVSGSILKTRVDALTESRSHQKPRAPLGAKTPVQSLVQGLCRCCHRRPPSCLNKWRGEWRRAREVDSQGAFDASLYQESANHLPPLLA